MSLRPAAVRLSLAALALCAAAVGCAGEEPLVDRVQTNLVAKSIFEGEWWYSATTIDVDFDEAATFGSADAFGPFEGSMSVDYALDFNRGGTYVLSQSHSLPIARIRWVIDEDFLYAYRSYELTLGAEPDGDAPDFRGQPLAVFAIESHVDVRREYNPQTGEETNVRVENASDRDWNERGFMRVDWSQNLLTSFAANAAAENALFNSFRREPASLYVDESEPGYPESWRPQFVTVGEDPDYRWRGEWSEDDEDVVHAMSFVTQEVWSPGGNCLSVGGTCASALVTLRNGFLRVPPGHEFAARTLPHEEFDRFGIIRSAQPTYATGGADRADLRIHCFGDADCGPGGACDLDEHACVGGLTDERGETDFLTFYMSIHGFHSDSLSDTACVSDWECDARYLVCDEAEDRAACEATLRSQHGSVCDPAARRCTIPLREREDSVRPVEYRLSPGFPPHLVRQAFEAVAHWNEALMRAHRAALGRLPIEARACDAAEERDAESGAQVAGDGRCTADLVREALVACQDDDPAAYCWCGAPEAAGGRCPRRYDPFEMPEAARERGVPNPYDCWVEGPPDVARPTAYEDYDPAEAYGYRFRGDDCLLVLRANACDLDAQAPCEEIGDLRYQFLTHVQHGAVTFGGVAQPLSDPTTGELVVSNASVAAESIESIGTVASQYFPVLRGEVPEDEYFSGESLRGYFSRLGRVEHPVSLAASGTDGYTVADPSRPPESFADADAPSADAFRALAERLRERLPAIERLRGQEGRAAILSDRLHELTDSPLATRVRAVLTADADPAAADGRAAPAEPVSLADAGPLTEALAERERRKITSARFLDDFSHKLYDSQYWRYWAEAFEGRPIAEAAIRMQQAYFRGVMAHEVGHALGLEHNFAASLDRDQYPDAYFRLARDVPLPAYLDYDSAALDGNEDGDVTREEATRWATALRTARQERLERGAGNVMSSSVMDYHGDLSDFAGTGRYDAAAVGFAYFDRVEAYALRDVFERIDWDGLAADGFDVEVLQAQGPRIDPDNPTSLADGPSSLAGLSYSDAYPRELWTYYRGGERCAVDNQCPHASGRETTIYQPVTQRCVTNPRYGDVVACGGRGGCLCSNFDDDFRAYTAGDAYGNGPREYAPVTYRFCDGTRTNDISWCTQFDAGETFQETVEHYRRGWLERYPQAYFRNFRRALPQRGASWGSVVEAVKIYQHLFFRSNFEGAAYNNDPGPLGFYDQLYASADVLNWLVEIIGAPDVGSYAFDADANLYRPISNEPGAAGSDLDLGVGHGFYLWSQYQEGLNGFFRLERAGTFLDKLLALEALTRRDWGLGYTVDERYYVNFYDVFDREVLDLFGGLILRNPAAYAPRVVDDGSGEPSLRYLSAFRGFFVPPGANNAATFPEPAIDGTDTEVLRDAAAIQALAEFAVYYDTSFEQRLLVFKLGSGDGYEIPATRTDGTPTCGWGEAGCTAPDFITYDSDRLHTTYVAVLINPDLQAALDERQLGFELLKKLRETQDRIRTLEVDPDRDAVADAELERLRLDLERDESFVEYLIELAREFGISSWIR